MKVFRELDYDYCGRLLHSDYHNMSARAHRVMNRLARYLALQSSRDGEGRIESTIIKVF